MGQVSRYIPAPYQGVSQAPSQVRLDAQAEAVENYLLYMPQGAGKRPPFSWQGRLGGHQGLTNGTLDYVDTGGVRDAFLTLSNESGTVVPRLYSTQLFPRGYEPAGLAPLAITIDAAAQTYLNAGAPNPVTDFVVTTIEDTTFVLNRKVTVTTSGTFAPARPYEAMIWVRQAAYSRSFNVTVTPTAGTPVYAALHTPNGAAATDGQWVDTTLIASVLQSATTYSTTNDGSSNGVGLDTLTSQGFTVTRKGPVIYISGPVDFQLIVNDGLGGGSLVPIKDQVQHFSDLPAIGIDGFTIKIAQQTGEDSDDFWAKFVAIPGGNTGVWQETIRPGAELGLDVGTMPMVLVYESGWKLRPGAWKPRKVGDEKVAPDPDFVGRTLQDITFLRGRLGLLSEEEIALSSSADAFQFYPETCATQIDTDPVYLLSPYPSKSKFKFAVPLDERLVLFANLFQCAVTGQELTAAGARVDLLQTFEYAGILRPIASNGKLYFTATHGPASTTVYEFATERLTANVTGEDMTAAIPQYLPSGVDRQASSPINYLNLYSKSGTGAIYPHLYRHAEQQRVQNAWSRWTLPEGWTVGGMLCRNTQLYVLACYGGEAHLVSMDLTPGLVDPDTNSKLLTRLDFRLSEGQVSRSYSSGTDLTTIAIPYPLTAGLQARLKASVRAPGGGAGPASPFPEGFLLAGPTGFPTSRSLTAPGDWTTAPMWVGLGYDSYIILSKLYVLGRDNQPVRSGRLTLRRVALDVSDTGYLRAEVTAGGRTPFVYEWTGYVLDDPASILDQVPRANAIFVFPVKAFNEAVSIKIINDSHLSSQILGMEWTGEFNPRSSRG